MTDKLVLKGSREFVKHIVKALGSSNLSLISKIVELGLKVVKCLTVFYLQLAVLYLGFTDTI